MSCSSSSSGGRVSIITIYVIVAGYEIGMGTDTLGNYLVCSFDFGGGKGGANSWWEGFCRLGGRGRDLRVLLLPLNNFTRSVRVISSGATTRKKAAATVARKYS